MSEPSSFYGVEALLAEQIADGTAFRVVKVPHTLESLKRRIEALGCRLELEPLGGQFFWGHGSRAS